MECLSFHVSSKMQRFCAHMGSLPRVCTGRRRCGDGYVPASVGLHCGRYAPRAGSARDYRIDVPKYIRRYFYGRLSDAVGVCDKRNQFLFPVNRRNCGDWY